MTPQSQVRPKTTPVESNSSTLWQQLDPQTRRQLTQQWATMIQKMRQKAQSKADDHESG
jgi:hypothetical protein